MKVMKGRATDGMKHAKQLKGKNKSPPESVSNKRLMALKGKRDKRMEKVSV